MLALKTKCIGIHSLEEIIREENKARARIWVRLRVRVWVQVGIGMPYGRVGACRHCLPEAPRSPPCSRLIDILRSELESRVRARPGVRDRGRGGYACSMVPIRVRVRGLRSCTAPCHLPKA